MQRSTSDVGAPMVREMPQESEDLSTIVADVGLVILDCSKYNRGMTTSSTDAKEMDSLSFPWE